jgi:hypothetical protein
MPEALQRIQDFSRNAHTPAEPDRRNRPPLNGETDGPLAKLQPLSRLLHSEKHIYLPL